MWPVSYPITYPATCPRREGSRSGFRTHVRKEQHITNRSRPGHQHHQAIDAYTEAASRRQSDFERADVVGVVVHRLLVAGFLRLRLGGGVVLKGALLGIVLTAMVAVLTFVLQQRLPYRKMLITTGILLGVVLLVMVGEQAQEMQLAHWIPTTPISQLENVIPAWVGMWFAVFPTVETLVAQTIAAVLVIGSYFAARGTHRLTQADKGTGHLANNPAIVRQLETVP